MKKYIFSLAAIIIVLSACKKDAIDKSKKTSTSPVTFNVGFSQSIQSFSVSNRSAKFVSHNLAATSAVDSVLASEAAVLYVAVYQQDGSRLYLTKQLATDTVFGRVNYNLPPGNYTIVFCAGQSGLTAETSGGGSGNISNDEVYYITGTQASNVAQFQETFFQKINLTVGASGINQNISLSRATAEIDVDIEDAIPANVKYIAVTASDFADPLNPGPFEVKDASLSFQTGLAESINGAPGASTSFVTPLQAGVKNTKLKIVVLSTSRTFQVKISATDAMPTNPLALPGAVAGQLLYYSVTNNVATQTNHQTVLTGQLFGGNGTSNTGGFQVKIDPVWDPTPITVPFQ